MSGSGAPSASARLDLPSAQSSPASAARRPTFRRTNYANEAPSSSRESRKGQPGTSLAARSTENLSHTTPVSQSTSGGRMQKDKGKEVARARSNGKLPSSERSRTPPASAYSRVRSMSGSAASNAPLASAIAIPSATAVGAPRQQPSSWIAPQGRGSGSAGQSLNAHAERRQSAGGNGAVSANIQGQNAHIGPNWQSSSWSQERSTGEIIVPPSYPRGMKDIIEDGRPKPH
ncbi:hypothetical protein P389DRAFT_56424 [Cystobasidium minutum MCA 4210]|uniref:uncharacterized protein n=1 Tax=Cystobasidium minutum MCA 4210 TaxID=1397322 RepID=UPI0034CD6958|eukprot:jgi/Rhomi1/56424/CE56423_161